MITYSYTKKSEFWLKCHMPKHLIIEKLNEKVSAQSFAFRSNEYTGFVAENKFEMKRRINHRRKAVPRLDGTFMEKDDELYVHIVMHPDRGYVFLTVLSLIVCFSVGFSVLLGAFSPDVHWGLAAFIMGVPIISMLVTFAGWKHEVGYVINEIGEITRGKAVENPFLAAR